MFTFAVCGLWHGASWTFVAWGVLLGLYFVPITVVKSKRYLGTAGEGRKLPSVKEALAMLGTFSMVSLSWIFFKSETLGDAFRFIGRIFSHPCMSESTIKPYIPMLIASCFLLLLEWVQRKKDFVLQIDSLRKPYRWSIYYLCILLIAMFAKNYAQSDFIYFQF